MEYEPKLPAPSRSTDVLTFDFIFTDERIGVADCRITWLDDDLHRQETRFIMSFAEYRRILRAKREQTKRKYLWVAIKKILIDCPPVPVPYRDIFHQPRN